MPKSVEEIGRETAKQIFGAWAMSEESRGLVLPAAAEKIAAAIREDRTEMEKRIAAFEKHHEEQAHLISGLAHDAERNFEALTSERQRREEAENVAKPLADVLNEGLRVGAIGPDSEDTDSLYVQLSVLRAAQAYLRKYEPIPADREEERGG